MHTLLHRRHRRAARDLPAPAGRGPHALVLRDDRARRRELATRRTSRRPAVRDGDDWVLNGRKWCITGADGAAFSIVVAKTGDGRGGRPPQLLADPRADRHAGLADRPPPGVDGRALARRASRDRARRRPRARSTTCSATRARASASRSSGSPAAGSRTRCAGSAWPSARSTCRRSGCCRARRSARSSRATRRCSSCSPTRAMDLYASRLMVLHTAWKVEQRPAAPAGGRDDQDVRVRGVRPDRRPRGADARRGGHRARPADRADLPGRARGPDLRRRERGAPDGDRARAASSSPRRASRCAPRAGSWRESAHDRRRRHRPHARRRGAGRARAARRARAAGRVPRRARARGGRAGAGPARRRALQRDLRRWRAATRRSSCAGRRAARCRPAPTTCCARRACCARCRAARRVPRVLAVCDGPAP